MYLGLELTLGRKPSLGTVFDPAELVGARLIIDRECIASLEDAAANTFNGRLRDAPIAAAPPWRIKSITDRSPQGFIFAEQVVGQEAMWNPVLQRFQTTRANSDHLRRSSAESILDTDDYTYAAMSLFSSLPDAGRDNAMFEAGSNNNNNRIRVFHVLATREMRWETRSFTDGTFPSARTFEQLMEELVVDAVVESTVADLLINGVVEIDETGIGPTLNLATGNFTLFGRTVTDAGAYWDGLHQCSYFFNVGLPSSDRAKLRSLMEKAKFKPLILPPSIVADWRMDAHGSNLVNWAGTPGGYNGVPAGAPGQVEGGVTFDGVDDTFAVPAVSETVRGWMVVIDLPSDINAGSSPQGVLRSQNLSLPIMLGEFTGLLTDEVLSASQDTSDGYGAARRRGWTSDIGTIKAGWNVIQGRHDPDDGSVRLYLNNIRVDNAFGGGELIAPYNAGAWALSGEPAQRFFAGTMGLARLYELTPSDVELEAEYDAAISLMADRGVALPPSRGLYGLPSGVVSVWIAEEQTNPVVLLDLLNGNEGTLVGSPTWIANPKGLAFNGIDQYASVDAKQLIDGGSSFTFCCVAEPGRTITGTLYSESATTSANRFLRIATGGAGNEDHIEVAIRDDAGGFSLLATATTLVIPDGVPTFIAVSYDATTGDATVYIDDGSEVLIGTASPTITSQNVATIGALRRTSDENFLQGRIYHAYTFDRALNAAEIGDCFEMSCKLASAAGIDPLANGLQASWAIDDGAGSQIITDSSGNGFDGQLGSTAGVDADDPTWIEGDTALQFDNAHRVNIPAAARVFRTGEQSSAMFWVKRRPGGSTANGYVYDEIETVGTWEQGGIYFNEATGQVGLFWRSSNAGSGGFVNYLSTAVVPDDGKLHPIGWSDDAAGRIVAIIGDSEEVIAVDSSTAVWAAIGAVALGCVPSSPAVGFLGGSVGLGYTWTRALNGLEIAQMRKIGTAALVDQRETAGQPVSGAEVIWLFDEGVGSTNQTIVDSSHAGNDATKGAANNPAWMSEGLRFDGVGSNANTVANQVVATTSWHAEMYVYLADNANSNNYIWSVAWGGTDADTPFQIRRNGALQSLNILIGADTRFGLGPAFDNAWRHIAVDVDSFGNYQCRIDGEVVDVALISIPPTATGQTNIFHRFGIGYGEGIAGIMTWHPFSFSEAQWAQQRAWVLAQMAPRHAAAPPVTLGMLAEYLFDEGSGQDTFNSRGFHNGILGTDPGVDGFDPAWASTGLSFTATDVVTIDSIAPVFSRATLEGTVMMVLNAPVQENKRLFGMGDSADATAYVEISTGFGAGNEEQITTYRRPNGGVQLTSAATALPTYDGSWHLVTASMHDLGTDHYRDGALERHAHGASGPYNLDRAMIGGYARGAGLPTGGATFDIAACWIWDRRLTYAEERAMREYARTLLAPRGIVLPPQPTAPIQRALMAHWLFTEGQLPVIDQSGNGRNLVLSSGDPPSGWIDEGMVISSTTLEAENPGTFGGPMHFEVAGAPGVVPNFGFWISAGFGGAGNPDWNAPLQNCRSNLLAVTEHRTGYGTGMLLTPGTRFAFTDDDTWRHVVQDQTNLLQNGWVDGQVDIEDVAIPAPPATAVDNPIYVGGRATGFRYNGILGVMMLYDDSLDGEERLHNRAYVCGVMDDRGIEPT